MESRQSLGDESKSVLSASQSEWVMPPLERDLGWALLMRRARQTGRLFFSPYLSTPSATLQMTAQRYSHPQELEFYRRFVDLEWTEDEREVFLPILENEFEGRKKALLVGCGAGREAFALEKLGFLGQGLDLSSAMVKEARKLAIGRESQWEFMEGGVDDLSSDFGSYDLIYITPALNGHIPGLRRRVSFYSCLRSLLKPDGLILMSPDIRPFKFFSHFRFGISYFEVPMGFFSRMGKGRYPPFFFRKP